MRLIAAYFAIRNSEAAVHVWLSVVLVSCCGLIAAYCSLLRLIPCRGGSVAVRVCRTSAAFCGVLWHIATYCTLLRSCGPCLAGGLWRRVSAAPLRLVSACCGLLRLVAAYCGCGGRVCCASPPPRPCRGRSIKGPEATQAYCGLLRLIAAYRGDGR